MILCAHVCPASSVSAELGQVFLPHLYGYVLSPPDQRGSGNLCGGSVAISNSERAAIGRPILLLYALEHDGRVQGGGVRAIRSRGTISIQSGGIFNRFFHCSAAEKPRNGTGSLFCRGSISELARNRYIGDNIGSAVLGNPNYLVLLALQYNWIGYREGVCGLPSAVRQSGSGA